MTAGFSLYRAAQCRGVYFHLSRASRTAPALSKVSMTAGFSLAQAAKCRGVDFDSSRAFRLAPAFKQAVTLSTVAFWKYLCVFHCPQSGAGCDSAVFCVCVEAGSTAWGCGSRFGFTGVEPTRSTAGSWSLRSAFTSSSRASR